MHQIAVVLRDDFLAEELDALERLLARQVVREAEDELVDAGALVGAQLLAHLLGRAAEKRPGADRAIDRGRVERDWLLRPDWGPLGLGERVVVEADEREEI